MNISNLAIPVLLIASFSFCADTIAQPVVLNGNNFAAVGTKDTITFSSSSTVSPGTPGANVTWNISAVSGLTKSGILEIVNAASTPFAVSYPSANKVSKFTSLAGASSYHYRRMSATGYETIAEGVTATTGNDYSANPKLVYPIPFHYNDVVIDTFQLGSSTPTTSTITYDGYGTLITPYGTYTNVIRYKSDNGTTYGYTWLRTNPLYYVASYSNSNQQFTFIGNTSVTGISEQEKEQDFANVYPNPFTDRATIMISSNIKDGRFILSDISGRIVRELDIRNNKGVLDREGISSGLYTYTIENNKVIIAKGRLSIQ